MAEISKEAGEFMARFFSMGRGSLVTSHGPHKKLEAVKAAFEECKANDLITVEAYNDHGSIRITATDAGYEIARQRFAAVAAEMFDGGSDAG